VYPVTLTGERIRLREFRSDDLDACMDVVGDPDVTHSLSFDTRSRESHAPLLAADISRAQQPERPDYYLGIANTDDRLIGFARIGLTGRRGGELGYAVRRADWRKATPATPPKP
jgi:RimJ/RimL family protein N-acetyltransferase